MFVAIEVVAVLVVSTLAAGRLLANDVDGVDTPEALSVDYPVPRECSTQRMDPSGLSSVHLFAIAPRRAIAKAADLDEFSRCEHLPVRVSRDIDGDH